MLLTESAKIPSMENTTHKVIIGDSRRMRAVADKRAKYKHQERFIRYQEGV